MSRPDIPVTIGADDREFRTAMTRVRMQARTAANDTASSFLSIRKKIGGLDGIFGALRGGPAGLAASLGLGVIVSETQKAVDAVADLGKAAKTAGVDFEAFQELRYAAVKNRIELSALTDGLKEMQLRADEFVKTGGGSAAESFKRLGLSARQLTRMLEDPAAMFETLIGKIRELDRAAQIRVLDEIFGGTAAEEFTSLMDDAGQSISDAREEARDMGAVMDDELLQQAEDINAEWETMALIIGTNVKGALVDIGGLISGLIGKMQDLSSAIQNARVGLRAAEAGAKMGAMAGDPILLDPVDVTTGYDMAADYADYNAGREILEQKLAANREVTAELQRQNGLTSDQLALEKEMAAVRKIYEEAGGAPTKEMVRAQAEARLAAKTSRRSSGKSGGGGGSASAAVDREREAVEKLIQALQDELRMTEMTADQKKVFENLRRAGTAATDSEKASIRELTFAIEEQKHKQEAAADTAEFFRDTARDSFLALIPAIETGNAALDSMINKLIEAAAQAALFGDGPLGGLLDGGLLGGFLPAHATGTNFTQGGMALVGERGPEILKLPRGGEIIPNHRLGAVSSSSSSGSVISSVSIGDINVSVPEDTDPKDAVAMGKEFRKQIDAVVDRRLQENARARGMLAGGPF
ncbi:phage tail tape measure protein [Martelella sp. AD-3]|uniref:phage tail tape measure protein n=1 Tax=Martelella sp. AD-3 TaxID=686597 RepID=UPI0004633A75|nr:phage tail tape measure protein [Martelella sp. AD-3]AMM84820.1 hypothetical protein AZF01_10995 [Martelella sp. AD-3]